MIKLQLNKKYVLWDSVSQCTREGYYTGDDQRNIAGLSQSWHEPNMIPAYKLSAKPFKGKKHIRHRVPKEGCVIIACLSDMGLPIVYKTEPVLCDE